MRHNRTLVDLESGTKSGGGRENSIEERVLLCTQAKVARAAVHRQTMTQ